jgi:hypothetical protein
VVCGLLFFLYMFWGHDTHVPAVRLSGSAVATDFLDRLASQLKIGRDSAYRRTVQRTLEIVRKNYESGEYRSTTEAEHVFRKLVEQGDK